MNNTIQVPVATLRRATEILLDHVQKLEGPEVSLPVEYFWSISSDQVYDVYKGPSDLAIGQVTECLDNIQRFVDEPSGVHAFALVWLSDLLRATGHTVKER